MTFPSRQASHLQLEYLWMRLSLRRPERRQLQARTWKQKSPRRLSHRLEPVPLAAMVRRRQRGAVHGAGERRRQVPTQSLLAQMLQTQSLRSSHQQTQLQQAPRKQAPRKQLLPERQSRRPPEQHPNSRRPSRRRARAPRVAMVRRLQRGADPGAAEPHCSPRRQRRPNQQLHPWQHRPRRLPHRPRRSRSLGQLRATRQLPTHPRLPSHPPRRRHRLIPARTILPLQLRHPARPAHR